MGAVNRGGDLERLVEEYFASSGYETERNVVREGRSGGRHELDVLATKSDGVTTFTVLVECKAWNQPIEKDVVAKLGYILGDVGINKGIVVSLEGWRAGAETAAVELGIELWDRFELEKRLGESLTTRAARASEPTVVTMGRAPEISVEQAERLLLRRRSGFLVNKERLLWVRPTWVPFHLLELRGSSAKRGLWAWTRAQVQSRAVFNAYEGIAGTFVWSFNFAPDWNQIKVSRPVPVRVSDRKITSDIAKACERLSQIGSQNALVRQFEKVQALGVPLPFDTLGITPIGTFHWPFMVGFFEGGDHERVVAVDGVGGSVSEVISRVATGHLGLVVEAIEG